MNLTNTLATAAVAMPIVAAADLIRISIRKRVEARRALLRRWKDVAEQASVELVLETVTGERDRARRIAVRLEQENARLMAERGTLVAAGLLEPLAPKAETDE